MSSSRAESKASGLEKEEMVKIMRGLGRSQSKLVCLGEKEWEENGCL